jgi:hypothetical protein
LDIALAGHPEGQQAEPEAEPEAAAPVETPPAEEPEKKKGVRVRTHH